MDLVQGSTRVSNGAAARLCYIKLGALRLLTRLGIHVVIYEDDIIAVLGHSSASDAPSRTPAVDIRGS